MIHAEKASFPVTRMTELLDVSTSGYYAWAERQRAEPGPRAALAEQITGFHKASDGVNGAPRILADLRDAGEVVSRKAVAKIMAEQGMRTGVCWDNAQQESFWSTLRTVFYDRYSFATRAVEIPPH